MNGEEEEELDLSQIFSDVSRTVNGLKNMIGSTHDDSSHGKSDNVCFKACGMEDIQFAARKAGELLITTQKCMVAMTLVTTICMLLLTGAIIYCVMKRRSQLVSEHPSTNTSAVSTSDEIFMANPSLQALQS